MSVYTLPVPLSFICLDDSSFFFPCVLIMHPSFWGGYTLEISMNRDIQNYYADN